LAQAQEDLLEKHSNTEREKLDLQTKWEEEKAELQQSKEQLLIEKLEIKELFNRALFLCDSHRSPDRRMGSTTCGTTGRSDLAASATHHRSGTLYCARDPLRHKRPKRGNFPQRSWQIEIP
jgi:hypothetical protein